MRALLMKGERQMPGVREIVRDKGASHRAPVPPGARAGKVVKCDVDSSSMQSSYTRCVELWRR